MDLYGDFLEYNFENINKLQYLSKYIMEETINEKILGIPSRLVVSHSIPMLIKEFNFFNKLGNKKYSFEEIIETFGFDERVGEATIYYLLKEKFLIKENEIFFVNPEVINMLSVTGEFNLSSYVNVLRDMIPQKFYSSIKHALIAGTPAKWQEDNWEESMRQGKIAKDFSNALMSRAELLKHFLILNIKNILENQTKVLDIGGSLGDYSGAFTSAFENISSDIFELPKVAEVTKSNIKEKKYERVGIVSGDMFKQELPTGYDTHFYSNVLHDWKVEEVKHLLKKSYNSLSNNGLVFIHDMHLNEDKISPSYVVDHSMYLSIFTNGKCYSKNEMSALLKEAGFSSTGVIDTVSGYSVIWGRK